MAAALELCLWRRRKPRRSSADSRVPIGKDAGVGRKQAGAVGSHWAWAREKIGRLQLCIPREGRRHLRAGDICVLTQHAEGQPNQVHVVVLKAYRRVDDTSWRYEVLCLGTRTAPDDDRPSRGSGHDPTPSSTDDNIVSGVRRADLQPLPLLSYARGRGTRLDASQLIRYLAEAGCPLTFPDEEKALPYAGPSSWARFDPTDSDGSGADSGAGESNSAGVSGPDAVADLRVAMARRDLRALIGNTERRSSIEYTPLGRSRGGSSRDADEQNPVISLNPMHFVSGLNLAMWTPPERGAQLEGRLFHTSRLAGKRQYWAILQWPVLALTREDTKEVVTCVDIRRCRAVDPAAASLTAFRLTEREYKSPKVTKLHAPTEADRDAWVRALRRALPRVVCRGLVERFVVSKSLNKRFLMLGLTRSRHHSAERSLISWKRSKTNDKSWEPKLLELYDCGALDIKIPAKSPGIPPTYELSTSLETATARPARSRLIEDNDPLGEGLVITWSADRKIARKKAGPITINLRAPSHADQVSWLAHFGRAASLFAAAKRRGKDDPAARTLRKHVRRRTRPALRQQIELDRSLARLRGSNGDGADSSRPQSLGSPHPLLPPLSPGGDRVSNTSSGYYAKRAGEVESAVREGREVQVLRGRRSGGPIRLEALFMWFDGGNVRARLAFGADADPETRDAVRRDQVFVDEIVNVQKGFHTRLFLRGLEGYSGGCLCCATAHDPVIIVGDEERSLSVLTSPDEPRRRRKRPGRSELSIIFANRAQRDAWANFLLSKLPPKTPKSPGLRSPSRKRGVKYDDSRSRGVASQGTGVDSKEAFGLGIIPRLHVGELSPIHTPKNAPKQASNVGLNPLE